MYRIIYLLIACLFVSCELTRLDIPVLRHNGNRPSNAMIPQAGLCPENLTCTGDFVYVEESDTLYLTLHQSAKVCCNPCVCVSYIDTFDCSDCHIPMYGHYLTFGTDTVDFWQSIFTNEIYTYQTESYSFSPMNLSSGPLPQNYILKILVQRL